MIAQSKFAATLMVDASWCPETGAGGYGYGIASFRGRHYGGGPLKARTESSNLAEMQAICIVLYIATNLGFIMPEENVLIQTDCKAAIEGFAGVRRLTKDECTADECFHLLSRPFKVALRHVKGHSRSSEARHTANNLCDMRAKTAMREARDKILVEQHGLQAASS